MASAIVTAALFALPAWQTWDTWPAVDRHDDMRPRRWLDQLTRGLDTNAVLFADINWQLDNGLDYYTRHLRPDLNIARVADRVLTLPLLVRDNLAAGQTVWMTPESRRMAESAYGDLFAFAPDSNARPLGTRLHGAPSGSLYVIALLAPYRDLPFDAAELADASRRLTGGAATLAEGPSYQVLAGRVGEPPMLDRRQSTPFRTSVPINAIDVEVRMESWLPADTMRRAGFGHVIINRRHALTLERGVSVVLLDSRGAVLGVDYASGLFAPLPRVRVQLAPAQPGP